MKNAVLAIVFIAAGYYIWETYLQDRFSRQLEAHDEVIVYASGTCGRPCREMIAMLRQERVVLVVHYIDEDDEARQELRKKLDAIGFDQQIYKLPVVDVYGHVLPDNPSRKNVKATLP